MTETDGFKLWLQTYLLDLDKDFDTDVYLDYIYEILTNFSPNPCNKSEIVDSLHSILESLLPDILVSKSDEILAKYIVEVNNNEISQSNAESEKCDVLYEMIQKDKQAIDVNKRHTTIDPKHALDYKHADIRESDEDSFDEAEIDAEFDKPRQESARKIDDVLCAFDAPNAAAAKSVSITKQFLMTKCAISDDDDESGEFDCGDYGKANRDAVDKAAHDERARLKEKSAQKKEKDKVDRAKQKEQVKARKDSEKKRTQKSEKRR